MCRLGEKTLPPISGIWFALNPNSRLRAMCKTKLVLSYESKHKTILKAENILLVNGVSAVLSLYEDE